MSATETETQTTYEFTSRKRPSRSRNGAASVITPEMLDALVDALGNLGDDEEIPLAMFPRPSKGSAAGFGYQVKIALQTKRGAELAAAGVTGGVHSSVRPDPEWDEDADGEQPDKLTQAQIDAGFGWYAALSK